MYSNFDIHFLVKQWKAVPWAYKEEVNVKWKTVQATEQRWVPLSSAVLGVDMYRIKGMKEKGDKFFVLQVNLVK